METGRTEERQLFRYSSWAASGPRSQVCSGIAGESATFSRLQLYPFSVIVKLASCRVSLVKISCSRWNSADRDRESKVESSTTLPITVFSTVPLAFKVTRDTADHREDGTSSRRFHSHILLHNDQLGPDTPRASTGLLHRLRLECAEDISCAKVNPATELLMRCFGAPLHGRYCGSVYPLCPPSLVGFQSSFVNFIRCRSLSQLLPRGH